jgi:hypothetical protein
MLRRVLTWLGLRRKRCPFCAHRAYLREVRAGSRWAVGCANRLCRVAPVVASYTALGAVEIWNRRTSRIGRWLDEHIWGEL